VNLKLLLLLLLLLLLPAQIVLHAQHLHAKNSEHATHQRTHRRHKDCNSPASQQA
jgi:hypothetical protein